MTTSLEIKELLSRFIEDVWNAGRIEAAGEYVAQRYTIHHDPGDPWDGQTIDLEGYMERARVSRAPFPDQHFTIYEMLAEGDRVAMIWSWVGTHAADLPGFPASGKRIRFSGATLYYLDGGRLTGHWQITDRLGVYNQLRGG